jgi:hypothetical protein
MDTNPVSHEKGQNAVIIAIMMVVLIGIMALAVDGGLGYAKRREAQNAADAAALAGADLLCGGAPAADVRNLAEEYVLKNGGLQPAYEDIIIGDHAITVTSYVSHPTFFAGLLGSDNIIASATAAAGCFSPCVGTGVLPVAWACQPPAGGGGGNGVCDPNDPNDPDCSCVVEAGSYGPPLVPGPLYIIMDSRDVNQDFYCQNPPNSGMPSGALDCDLNNDGYDDLLAGGDRSWLDLSGGGGGASDMRDWIINGFPNPVVEHTWFAGQSGVANTVFQAVYDRMLTNPIVILPVFNDFCDGLPGTNCPSQMHPQDVVVPTSATSQLYFHVITYSVFRITCVEAPGVPGNPDCPGKNAAQAANPGLIPNNTKSIEGYFLEGYVPGLGGACEGPGAGAWTIYLNH